MLKNQNLVDRLISSIGKRLRALSLSFSFPTEHRIRLLRTLRSVLDAGGHPSDFAVHLKRFGSPIEKEIGLKMARSLQSGQPYATAFKNIYPDDYANALLSSLVIGEEAFKDGLNIVADTMSNRSAGLSEKISPLVYPGIFSIVTMFFVIGYASAFEPMMVALAKSTNVSALTWLVGLSDFYKHGMPVVTAIGMVAFFSASFYVANATKNRELIDTLPLLSIYRKSAGARLIALYALMRGVGVDIKSSLEKLQENANPFERLHLRKMRQRLKGSDAGQISEVDILNTGLLEPSDVSVLRLLTYNSIDFVHALRVACVQLEKSVDRQLKWLFRLIALLLWMFILFNILSVLIAMFSIKP